MANLLQETLLNKLLLEDLDSAYERYYADKMDRETFDRIIKLDPTYKHNDDPKKASIGSYGKWLLKQYNPNNPMTDAEYWTTTLEKFNDIKGKLEPNQRDIFRYKDIEALQAVIDANADKRSVSDWQIKAKQFGNDIEFLGATPNFEVYSPKTFEASRYIRNNLGNGDAGWCTGQYDYHFNGYTQDGALYIILSKKEDRRPKNKFQVCIQKETYGRDRGSYKVREFRDAENYDYLDFIEFLANNPELEPIFTKKTLLPQTAEYKELAQIKELKETKTLTISGIMRIKGSVLAEAIKYCETLKLMFERSTDSRYSTDELSLNKWTQLKRIITEGTVDVYAKDCTTLEEVRLGFGVVRIRSHAFEGCRNLKLISLPDTLREIELDAFVGCDRLQTIEMSKRAPGKGIRVRKTDINFLKNKVKYTDPEVMLDPETGELTKESINEAYENQLPDVLKKYLAKHGKHSAGIRINTPDGGYLNIPLEKIKVEEIHPVNARDVKLKWPYIPIFIFKEYSYSGDSKSEYMFIKGSDDFDANTYVYDPNFDSKEARRWSLQNLVNQSTHIYVMDSRDYVDTDYTKIQRSRTNDFRDRDANYSVRPEERKQRATIADRRWDIENSPTYNDRYYTFDKSGYKIPPMSDKISKLTALHSEEPVKYAKKLDKLLKEAKKEYTKLITELTFDDSSELSRALGDFGRRLSDMILGYNDFVNKMNEVLVKFKTKQISKSDMQETMKKLFEVNAYGNSRMDAQEISTKAYALLKDIRNLKPATLEAIDSSELAIVLENLNKLED